MQSPSEQINKNIQSVFDMDPTVCNGKPPQKNIKDTKKIKDSKRSFIFQKLRLELIMSCQVIVNGIVILNRRIVRSHFRQLSAQAVKRLFTASVSYLIIKLSSSLYCIRVFRAKGTTCNDYLQGITNCFQDLLEFKKKLVGRFYQDKMSKTIRHL